ncbi:YlbF family regulator [Streptococcus hongkongensis]|nr:hypothetical protein NC01_03180 [Streptococcus uberis]
MLVINEDLIIIEDAIDSLVNELVSSPEFINYKEKLKIVDNDHELQESISELKQLTDNYTQEEFIRFRPELREMRKSILAKKKELDTSPNIIALRYAEIACQEILAKISQQLASAVSPTIFIDTGLPLASRKKHPKHGRYQNIKEKD